MRRCCALINKFLLRIYTTKNLLRYTHYNVHEYKNYKTGKRFENKGKKLHDGLLKSFMVYFFSLSVFLSFVRLFQYFTVLLHCSIFVYRSKCADNGE